MPPGPAYNWLCVASSALEILSHASRIRTSQVAKVVQIRSRLEGAASVRCSEIDSRHEKYQSEPHLGVDIANGVKEVTITSETPNQTLQAWLGNTATDNQEVKEQNEIEESRGHVPDSNQYIGSETSTTSPADLVSANDIPSVTSEFDVSPEPIPASAPGHVSPNVAGLSSAVSTESMMKGGLPAATQYSAPPMETSSMRRAELKSSKVPSSRLARLVHYGGLAASMGFGAASELVRGSGQGMMSEPNIRRLVSKLSQMRGAALKLGQFMSIQDTHILPPEVDKVFRMVQDSAHYMPDYQLEQVMQAALGPSWSSNFTSFDRVPFAAASIGQVHSAMLSPSVSPTHTDAPVAVKVQFPKIQDSIESDIGYVRWLLTASMGKVLPKGLFLGRTIDVMKSELRDECDYRREAHFLRKFGSPAYLGEDGRFKVPWVWEGSTDTVLVMEKVDGMSVGEAKLRGWSQEDRNEIASRVVELCLKELFQFRSMQTDPNYSNFLWNEDTRQVELVDFGATREYSKTFMDDWLRILQSAASGYREQCIEASLRLGYLTGEEEEVMLDAHVESMTLLATPFKESTKQPYSFGKGSEWEKITQRIREQIPVMLRHRLTPPPRETYSLNRKLSGAFLLASRLEATVDTKALWDKVIGGYRFDERPEPVHAATSTSS